MAKGEELKLGEKRKEIEKQKERRTNLKLLNAQISKKIDGLGVYDKFLKEVITNFSDEF